MRMSTPGCVLVRIQIVTAAVAVAGGQRRGGRRQSTRCWGGGVWQGAGVRGGGHVDRHGRRRERRPSTSLAPTEAPRWAFFGNDGRCLVAVGREVAATTAATTAAVAMSSHLRLREQTIDVANRAGRGGRMRTRWRRQRGGGANGGRRDNWGTTTTTGGIVPPPRETMKTTRKKTSGKEGGEGSVPVSGTTRANEKYLRGAAVAASFRYHEYEFDKQMLPVPGGGGGGREPPSLAPLRVLFR